MLKAVNIKQEISGLSEMIQKAISKYRIDPTEFEVEHINGLLNLYMGTVDNLIDKIKATDYYYALITLLIMNKTASNKALVEIWIYEIDRHLEKLL